MKVCFLAILILLGLSPFARAAESDVSDRFVTAVEPADRAYEPAQLIGENAPGFWQPNRKSWGYGSETLWLRGTLARPRDQVLSLPYASPTQADFFVYNTRGQLLKSVVAGTYAPLEGRELKLNLVGIFLDYPAEESVTVLIRQRSKSLLDTHYVLRDTADHRIVEWVYLAGYGLYFGLALALFFHNLSLYFSVRDRVYLAYLVFVVCLSATMLFSSAYYALFWYRLPGWLHNVPYATPAFLNIGAAYFASTYLRLHWRKSWLARAMLVWSLVSLCVVITHWYRPALATPWNPYLNFGMIILTVSACSKRILQGERYAWFLLAAVLCPFLSVVVYYCGNLIFKVSVNADIVSVAFALEMLLMSTGLGHRVYVLRQRQIEMQAQQENLIHQSKMRALADMASGVAHEVNNPLMIIGGYAEVIRRLIDHEPLDRERIQDNTQRIDRNVHRIAFIVQALRSFAQEDSETPVVSLVFQDLVEQALALCESRIVDRGIQLNTEILPRPLWIAAQRTELVEVILALLDNAMEALKDMPDRVLLVALESATHDSGEFARLIIQDSGAGVPPELRKRLFQPFFTTRTVGEGAGLSLSRSLGVVQSLQGTLTYERRATVTRFIIELPLRNL